MVAEFNNWGLLPPYVGNPALPSAFTPYAWTAEDLTKRMGFNATRKSLLSNLIEYRKELRNSGVTGIQLIDGSFLEDSERLQGRPPGDIDIINLIHQDPKSMPTPHVMNLLTNRSELKIKYQLDVMAPIPLFFDNLGRPAVGLESFTYFFSLFSHCRDKHFGFPVWKGMVQLDLTSNSNEDDGAILLLMTGATP